MKTLNYELDSSCWRMYYALRNTDGAVLMAIEFMHNGRLWRADTEDEAIKLRRKLEDQDRVAEEMGQEPDSVRESVWTPDMAMELLKNAGELQKKFLRVLYEGTEVTSDKVIKKLALDSEIAFAGVLSGLSKQLKKLGVKPWNLYDTRVQWSGKVKNRSFQLAGDFRWVAVEIGWPEKWF